MKMSFLSFLIFVLLLHGLSAAAVSGPREMTNALYVEYAGSGGLYSLNYDRVIWRLDEMNGFGARAGLSWLPLKDEGIDNILILPMMATWLYGRTQHFLEVDAGVALRTASNKYEINTRPYPAFNIGYRARAPGSGATFRIGISPLFFDGLKFWGQVSIGRAF